MRNVVLKPRGKQQAKVAARRMFNTMDVNKVHILTCLEIKSFVKNQAWAKAWLAGDKG